MTKPFRLTNKQVKLFTNDMINFGYKVTTEQIRKIADEVCAGKGSETDVVAMILKSQLKEAGIKLPENQND